MTMPIQINTLEYIKTLEEVGIPVAQAQGFAQALAEALATSTIQSDMVLLKSEMVARVDVLRIDLMARIDALRIEFGERMNGLERRVAVLERRMTTLTWMAGAILATQSAILVKVFS